MRLVNPLTLFRAAAASVLLLAMVSWLTATPADQTHAQTTVRGTRTPTATPDLRTRTTLRPTVTPTPDRLNGLGGTTGSGSTATTSGALASDEISGIIVGIDTTSSPPRVLVQTDTANPPTYANDPALLPGAALVYISDPAILPGLGLGMEITFGGTLMTQATSQGLYANQVIVEGTDEADSDPTDPYATDDTTYADPYVDNYTYDTTTVDNYNYADNYDHSDNYNYDNYNYDNYNDNTSSSSSSADNFDSADNLGNDPPNAPSGLKATSVAKDSVELKWTDNSNDEDGFKLEISTDKKKWSEFARVSSDTTSHPSDDLNAGKTYYYRVRAYNSYGNSSYSQVLTVKTAS